LVMMNHFSQFYFKHFWIWKYIESFSNAELPM
jgi:hypothetical protein